MKKKKKQQFNFFPFAQIALRMTLRVLLRGIECKNAHYIMFCNQPSQQLARSTLHASMANSVSHSSLAMVSSILCNSAQHRRKILHFWFSLVESFSQSTVHDGSLRESSFASRANSKAALALFTTKNQLVFCYNSA